MTFSEYQKACLKTAVYPDIGHNIIYPVLGLCGEAGEVAEKVKKVIRDEDGIITHRKRSEIAKEIGDVLWYIATICSELDLKIELIAEANIQKLISRKERDKIHGNGDNR